MSHRAKNRPSPGGGSNRGPSRGRFKPRGSAKVMHVSKSGAAKSWDHVGFMESLARLRDRAGIHSNVELAERVRERGNLPTFNASAMSKWGPRVQPSVETLREIANVVGVPPLELFLRAEVLRPEDISERPIPQVYRELIELDRDIEYYASRPSGLEEVFQGERDRLQDHIVGLVHLTRERVIRFAETVRIAQPPQRRRSRKTESSE